MVILSDVSEASSSSPRTYDVFLSFRGSDTRYSFNDHLYNALKEANLKTFLDDEEIETGLYLKPELESAIKASRASIIVLSKNYASSTWCLEELVFILEQKRTSGHMVIPIFYHVEPTDVRKQQGSFGDAMAKHKQRMEDEINLEEKRRLAQKMEIWKKALTQVSNLKGKDAKDRLETEFIKEIVEEIYHRLGVPSSNTLPHLIGMYNDIKFITSWLKDGSEHTADILTIVGMGGIGKTSLAKYVYGSHCHEFNIRSFIGNISRRCADKFNGFLDVQKQLCGDILRSSSIQVHDVSVYTSMIENALKSKKVLVVLDDIDSLDQLDAFLGNKGFHRGSKIIITTKDASLIESCALSKTEAQPKHTKHLLKGINETASLKLLSFHAFKSNNPNEGYKEVSEKVVNYCEGHPLALEVLGKSLHNRDVPYWEACIKVLKKETGDSHVNNVLRMSFDTLTENDKELFLHIACFFVGIDRDYAETILNECNIVTRSGIMNLTDKCLLSIGCENKLWMHQLLQEMGRYVVRQASPLNPGERSRLWCHKESFKVLKQKKGTEKILGLFLDMKMLEEESAKLETEAFSKMENLMLLQLNHVQLNGSNKNFPENLRWLCMHGFPSKSIPLDLPMEHLVALDMSYSNIKSFDMSYSNMQRHWKSYKQLIGSRSKQKRLLGSLKILDLSFCEQLRSLGGFFELPTLEKLIVTNCTGLSKVGESIEQCVALILIDLRYCYQLKKLPRALRNLKKVKTLLLDGCNLGESRNKIRIMDSLKMLRAKNIVKALPRDLKPFTISLPSSLVRLSLSNSNLHNESFPMDLSCLSMLKYLNLSGNPIVSMPNCVRTLPRLMSLSMSNCKMLISIQRPPCTLRYLRLRNHVTFKERLQQIVFDQEMSPLTVDINPNVLAPSSYEIEGMVKIQPMASVEEKVIRSLGWTNLDFHNKRRMLTYDPSTIREVPSQIQMYYEYGIFSTFYGGEEFPNWISDRSKGPSISFTIPSSHKKLTGLNFCYVHMFRGINETYQICREKYPPPDESFTEPNYTLTNLVMLRGLNDPSIYFPRIIISNITKNRTWMYTHCIDHVSSGGNCLTMLSHWMFGMNEMETGDQVTITLTERMDQLTRECGVGFVYEDGNLEEEDVLAYYKSWNHIIGGDLSAFQLTTGEYVLDKDRFWWPDRYSILAHYRTIIALGATFKEKMVSFRAFSQRNSNVSGAAHKGRLN